MAELVQRCAFVPFPPCKRAELDRRLALENDTGTRIPRPCAWKREQRTPASEPAVLVRRHPRGGWTHAIRVAGTSARIYAGHFASAKAAALALR